VIEQDRIRLLVRNAVAVRQVAVGRRSLLYLSLFDDEIDDRLGRFLDVWASLASPALDVEAAALALEPTDAAIIIVDNDEILVARGGACNFPLYWTHTAGQLVVSTRLPIDRSRCLSRTGLLASLAAVMVANQNELNLTLRTPLSGWRRIRRGAVSRLSATDGCRSEHPVDLSLSEGTDQSRDQLIEGVKKALDEFGRGQSARRNAVIELSGGMDSTLAAIAARKHGIELLGVSVTFPYYEFRFESDAQKVVAQGLTIRRQCLDGTKCLPFAPSDWMPKLDEPAISVISLERSLTMARIAAGMGVDRIFVGHGADQLFAEDMLVPERVRGPLSRAALTKSAWLEVDRCRALMGSSTNYLKRSSLTYSYDARFAVVSKEAFGATARSPFTSLDFARCGISWSRLSKRTGVRPKKHILADAFAGELPDAVAGRRGKVPWDGVSARGYINHGPTIVAELERAREPLQYLGVRLPWLRSRVTQLASGRKSTTAREDSEVIACYALAAWLRSWGVERLGDCDWDV
jgi:asparagine synthetase B (glutamine-hydrolysing)